MRASEVKLRAKVIAYGAAADATAAMGMAETDKAAKEEYRKIADKFYAESDRARKKIFAPRLVLIK